MRFQCERHLDNRRNRTGENTVPAKRSVRQIPTRFRPTAHRNERRRNESFRTRQEPSQPRFLQGRHGAP